MKTEKQPREQTTIRLPVGLKKEIEKEADKRDISFNSMVCKLLSDGIKDINHQN